MLNQLRDPAATTRVRQVVLMGGGLHRAPSAAAFDDEGARRLAAVQDLAPPPGWASFVEHDLSSDPAAALEVLGSGLPTLMVGSNLTRHAGCDPEELLRAIPQGGKLGQALREMEVAFASSFRIPRRTLHDPLACLVALDPSLVTRKIPVSVLLGSAGFPDPFSGHKLDRGRALAFPVPSSSVEAVVEVDWPGFRQRLLSDLPRLDRRLCGVNPGPPKRPPGAAGHGAEPCAPSRARRRTPGRVPARASRGPCRPRS